MTNYPTIPAPPARPAPSARRPGTASENPVLLRQRGGLHVGRGRGAARISKTGEIGSVVDRRRRLRRGAGMRRIARTCWVLRSRRLCIQEGPDVPDESLVVLKQGAVP